MSIVRMHGMTRRRRLGRQGRGPKLTIDTSEAKGAPAGLVLVSRAKTDMVGISGLGTRNDDGKGEGASDEPDQEAMSYHEDDAHDKTPDCSPTTSTFATVTGESAAAATSTTTPVTTTAPTATLLSAKAQSGDDDDTNDATGVLTVQPLSSTNSQLPAATSVAGTAAASLTTSSADAAGSDFWPSYPPPEPSEPPMSQTTEHVLIAAAAVVVTLIIVLVILGFYVMRRNGLTLRDVINKSKRGRSRPDRTIGISRPALHQFSAYHTPDRDLEQKEPVATVSTPNSRKSLPLPPEPSIQRTDTSLTQSTNPNYTAEFFSPPRRPNTPTQSNRSFFEEATPPRSHSIRMERARSILHEREISDPATLNLPLQSQPPSTKGHDRNISETPSSPVFPVQTNETRESSSQRNGEDDYVSPDPPAPSFQQFMANRPTSRRLTASKPNPNVSHFSWTTAQTPQTPHDSSRESSLSVVSRISHSSVARFRTVDSWVGNQTNRLPSVQLRGGLQQLDEGQAQSEFNDVPDVPNVPTQYKQGHERQNTTYSDATVFRQHPGTEVVIPRGSLVPSEILNERTYHSAL